MKYINLILITVLCFLANNAVIAQIPQTLSYQAVLTDSLGVPKPDGNYELTVRFYETVIGGSAIWTEADVVQTNKGLFHTILGDQVNFQPSLKFDRPYWMGIQIGNETELLPRIPLTSVAYSFQASHADTASVALSSASSDTVNYAQNVVSINNAKGGSIKSYIAIDLRDRSGASGRDALEILASDDNTQGTILVNKDNLLFWSSNKGESATLNCKKIIAYNGFVTGGFVAGGDNNLWLGSWEDHHIELATDRKRIRSTANPDGGLIFYTHSYQINPRWEFRDMLNESVKASINGSSGDAYFAGQVSTRALEIRGGSDLAEPFVMSHNEILPEGALVVIDSGNPGYLKLSRIPYDMKVAGVISGAGGVNPGLTLKQDGMLDKGQNVALTGRVFARATAANGAIQPGDLLTTSGLPGYAMKATDRSLRSGAVIGKAMTSLENGEGLVLVLVNLQ